MSSEPPPSNNATPTSTPTPASTTIPAPTPIHAPTPTPAPVPTIESDSITNGTRPAISDGKVPRIIWRTTDGNGDPSPAVFESSRNRVSGHPTWKLYCGDGPHTSEDGVLIEPPKYVYLDDYAAFQIHEFQGYSGPDRGRFWRHDFDKAGKLLKARLNRGRPVQREDGEVRELKVGVKTYRLSGALKAEDLELLARETEAQKRGENLLVEAPTKAKGKPRKRVNQLRDSVVQSTAATTKANDKDDDDNDPNGFDLAGPSAPKRPKLGEDSLVVSTLAVMGSKSLSELKASVIALEDRNRLMATSFSDLQNENATLKTKLASTETLKTHFQNEVASSRKLVKELQDQLQATAPKEGSMLAKDMENTMYRSQASIYRAIAVELWGKQKNAEKTMGVFEKTVKGVLELSTAIKNMEGAMSEAEKTGEKAKEEWEKAKENVKSMLGDQWEGFEKDAENSALNG